MPSPLVRQLAASIRTEPDRWTRQGRYVRRDDGIEIAVTRLQGGRLGRPRLNKPREVEFGFWESWMLARALRWWKRRPLTETSLQSLSSPSAW